MKRQATLHQLGKVQTSRSSSYWNVNIEDIEAHKKTLTNVGTSKEKFVAALRQLSSMLLTKDLLEQSMIGVCMNKIAKKHPDGEMRTLAKGIVESSACRRASIDIDAVKCDRSRHARHPRE